MYLLQLTFSSTTLLMLLKMCALLCYHTPPPLQSPFCHARSATARPHNPQSLAPEFAGRTITISQEHGWFQCSIILPHNHKLIPANFLVVHGSTNTSQNKRQKKACQVRYM